MNGDLEDARTRLTGAAASARDGDALLDRIARELARAVPRASCALVLVAEGGTLRARAASGVPIEGEARFGLLFGEGLSGLVAAEAEPRVVLEPAKDARVQSPALRAAGVGSLYAVPIVAKGEVFGVVHVGSASAEPWSAEDQATVRDLVLHVGPAVALHAARRDAERRATQQALVAELGRFALGGVTRRVLLARAARVVEEGLGAEAVAVLELVSGRFVVHASTGWTSEELDGLPPARSPSLHRGVAETLEPRVVTDLEPAAPSDRFLAAAEVARELRSAVAVPISAGVTRTFGVLVAHARSRAAFGPSHVDFLVAIANTVGESLLRFEEQDRVRASEEVLRLAAEAASLGTWDWFVDSGKLVWSDVTKEIYGLPRDAEIDYARFTSRVPPDDLERLEAHIRDALRPDGPGRMDIEHRIVRADGATRWLSAHAQTLFDELGRPVRIVGTTADVTARRRMSEVQDFLARASAELAMSLDVSETLRVVARLPVPRFAEVALVDLFVDASALEHVAVAVADRRHRAAASALERAGRVPRPADPGLSPGPARIVRVTDDEALSSLALDPAHAELHRAVGNEWILVSPLVARGRVFGLLTLGTKRRLDEVDLSLAEAFAARAALAVDNARLFADQVAARESAETARAALAASEERRRLALDAASLGTWHWDVGTGHVEADARARRLHAVPAEGPVTAEQLLASVHEADRERVRARLVEAFARRETAAEFECRVVDEGGAVRWIHGSGRVETDATGTPVRWAGISQDVTQRKQDEQQALAASRAKDEFLAMLGHELRNPLAPIATAVELMKMRGSRESERERAIIERQVKHLARLVDDLLDVSRFAAGRVQLELGPVEINEVVAQAIETASPLLEQRRHKLTVELPPEGIRLHADATRLAQVVANLLTNSAKYTNPGGHVTVRAAREGDAVVLRIVDDGIGIGPELLPRVFDAFAQGAQALDRSQGGMGLGLAIAKSLVTKHGGTIEARSEGEGKGTEMVVRLPAAVPVPAPPPPTRSRLTPARAQRQRVLVVDDNVDAAELLEAALVTAGFDVRAVFDPLDALEVAARFRPDVGVLDVGLPVMDGYELATKLRAHEGLGHLRLVAVTGYGQPEDRERAKAAGFDAHFVKPVDLRALARALGELAPGDDPPAERARAASS